MVVGVAVILGSVGLREFVAPVVVLELFASLAPRRNVPYHHDF